MSVKLIYAQLNNQTLIGAIRKLGSHYPYRDPKVRYSVEKFIRKWDQEVKTMRESISKDVKAYAELDKDGNLIFDPTSEAGVKMIPDKLNEWEKHVADFDKLEFTIEIDPFTREQFDTVALSPVEMISLEPLLEKTEEPAKEEIPQSPVKAVK